MTHIDRLLKISRNQRTRELLGAALNDAPPRGSLARVATGLGVVVGGSTWSAVAAGAGTAGASASTAVPAGALTVLGVGKLLAFGALAGTLVSGASVAIVQLSAPAAVTTRASAPRVVAAPKNPAPPVSETGVRTEAAPADVAATSASATTTGEAFAALPGAAGTTPKESGALAAEVARVDAARSALARGDTVRALAEIAAYRRERVLGVLDREAALLAIRAHSERGETARARELARRYLSEHPNDAHAPRLRELLGENEPRGDR